MLLSEKLSGNMLLYFEECCTYLLVFLPLLMSHTEIIADVEVGEHRSREVFALSGCHPRRFAWQRRKEKTDRVVSFRFERVNKAIDTLLACRSHIAIAHDSEAVWRKDEVEGWDGILERLAYNHLRSVCLDDVGISIPCDGAERRFRSEGMRHPFLGDVQERSELVEERYFPP